MERGAPHREGKITSAKIMDAVARGGLVASACFFFFPQFAANVMLEMHGVSFAFTGFYWFANSGMFVLYLLIAWKYHHPLAHVAFFPITGATGYGLTRFFIDSYLALNVPFAIASGTVVGLLLLNTILITRNLIRSFAGRSFLPVMRALRRSSFFKVSLAGFVAWAGLTSWSYVGFGATYTVADTSTEPFSVSFWGLPSGGFNVSHYSTPEGIAEMERYRQLNASFYAGVNVEYFQGNMTPWALMLEAWEPYDVDFIFNINPTNAEAGEDDFVSYHYLEEMNATINALMDWLEPLNLTNVRGISFDVEGPNFGNQPISREQYAKALVSYGGILSEFKSRFPGTSVELIQMDFIIFDFYDGDHDLDVALRTASIELDWDHFGFMTYMAGDNPTFSSYRYAMYLQNGVEQWGRKFQPWVGWWDDVPANETPVIERPGVYERSLEHVKIAKSFGVEEVVLAPVRSFIGTDHDQTKIIERLDDLIDIQAGFETFTVPVTQNMRLFTDWNLYWKKIVPFYIWSHEQVIEDLNLGTPGNWFSAIHAMFVAAGLAGFATCYFKRTD